MESDQPSTDLNNGNNADGIDGTFEGYEVITNIQVPTQLNWAIKPLYKLDQNGKMRIWQVGFNGSTNELITIYGQVGGAIQENKVDIVLNASGRSYRDQALLEAQKRYLDKYREDYREVAGTEVSDIPVQLAKDYQPPYKYQPDQSGNLIKVPVKSNITRFPVAVQAKFNGIRSRAKLIRSDPSGPFNPPTNDVKMVSRDNKPQDWLDLVRFDLYNFFKFLPLGVQLDGELYIHSKMLNQLLSIINNRKGKHPLNDQIQYIIFDVIVPNMTFNDRYGMLVNAYIAYRKAGYVDNYFKITTVTIANSYDDIDSYHDQYIAKGYEGLVIRKLAKPTDSAKIKEESYYRGNRNNNLMKYKKFQDEEGVVIGVYEGSGTEQGLANFTLRDKYGKEFGVRPAATFEERAEWFKHPDQVIGRVYTFKFIERTMYGIPFHATGVAFRD